MKLFFYAFSIISLTQIVFNTVKLIRSEGYYPQYKWQIIIQVVGQALTFLLFILSKRYIKAALIYSSSVTIILLVGSLEISIVGNPNTYEIQEGQTMIITMLVTISNISYNQTHHMTALILCFLHASLRGFFWIQDTFRYWRFVGFMAAAFFLIVYFSRTYNQL